MLPLLPSSTLTRTQIFVQQEWDAYFSNGRVDAIVSGWKGILYANYAIVDPVAAWNFFSQAAFDASWLDGGASRTWYLALAAGEFFAPFTAYLSSNLNATFCLLKNRGNSDELNRSRRRPLTPYSPHNKREKIFN